MVVLGTGEILLGPATVGGGKRCLSITGDPGKCQVVERKSDGVVVADDGVGPHNPARCQGPLLHRCRRVKRRKSVSDQWSRSTGHPRRPRAGQRPLAGQGHQRGRRGGGLSSAPAGPFPKRQASPTAPVPCPLRKAPPP